MLPTVCFITPPSPFLLDERVFPALGVLKVAAVAEALGYSVEHLDLNGVVDYDAAVEDYIGQHTDTSIFALTATTPQMVAATKIRKTIRYMDSEAKVILGGPHATLVHAANKTGSHRAHKALNQLLSDYDVVVAGDGEKAIETALAEYSEGLIDADDPKSGDGMFLTSKELSELPLPARHLVDLDSYHYEIDGVRVTSLISQLGCPFACNFCAGRDSAMLRRVRLRPTTSVIAEMRHIVRVYGVHGFMFFDDELNVNVNMIELMNAIDGLQQELGVGFRCRGFVKAELFTEAQASAMYRAGFRKIMCGFESGSKRILKNINKHATKDDNTRAMAISHKYELGMKALMSLGHPGESADTARATLDWLLEVKPQDFDVTIITAYPGSPYYDRAELRNDAWVFETNGDRLYMRDIDYTVVEDFYKGSVDSYKSYVWTDYLTAQELVWFRDMIERKVREKLGIPYYQAGAAVRFESSMGQMSGSVYRQGRKE